MQDKDLMQNMLLLEKGVCDLYMHGSIEASTQNINQAFKTALNESLTMQDSIYQQMSAKGWYSADTAEQDKINQAKQKFSNMQATS